ncbi:MAG: carbohydrate kinase family protein [Spirochaetales bacterium]|nr:carbohydrate kinase family protein [Candidatus Physcosoma equi]
MEDVLVIGASNTDLCGESRAKIIHGDSNIGKVTMAPGGVGHNIALNIALMGTPVRFITAIGNDGFGRVMEEHLRKHLNIEDAIWPDTGSGVYLYVADADGDMYVAVNDMAITERIDASFLRTKRETIEKAKLLVVDANLTAEAIFEATSSAKGIVMADCVSTLKADRLRPSFSNLSVLKPNMMELEYLSEVEIMDEKSLRKAADVLFDKGVKALLVTNGTKGSAYMSPERVIHAPCLPTKCVNATGAGDSFLGGFAHGLLKTGDPAEALRYAAVASAITVNSEETVSSVMSDALIENKIMEIETDDKVSGLF